MNFYFIRVPLRKKVLKYGTPKRRFTKSVGNLYRIHTKQHMLQRLAYKRGPLKLRNLVSETRLGKNCIQGLIKAPQLLKPEEALVSLGFSG